MARKNNIEGQLSLFEYLAVPQQPGDEQPAKRKAPAGKVAYAPGQFPQCPDCWCSTCEHSTVGGGKPRPFAGAERPCPSCEMCVREGAADVCVIGSAEEGCRYRAEEEGLVEVLS